MSEDNKSEDNKSEEHKSSTKPVCPYYGECGGCSSQHISYEDQLKSKLKIVSQNTGFPDDKIQIFSDKPYNYRNRMDLMFHPGGLGLRRKGDWKNTVDIKECAISDPELNKLIAEIRNNFKGVDAFDVRKKQGTYRYAVIRTPQNNSSISFVLNEDSMKLGDAVDKIKHYAKSSSANNVAITYVPAQTDVTISEEFFMVKGSDMLQESYLDKEFNYSIQGFFQNNTVMANKMHEHVHKLLTNLSGYGIQTSEYALLDLYAGVGTFGINNSGIFGKVVIAESDKHCIDSAKGNILKNKLTNAEAFLIDAMNLKKLELPEKLIVITDPPRSGMHPKTIEQLKKLKPKFMIYISCNVEQLGKDLKKFSEYELISTAMFDLFPQTPHIEAIVEMKLRN